MLIIGYICINLLLFCVYSREKIFSLGSERTMIYEIEKKKVELKEEFFYRLWIREKKNQSVIIYFDSQVKPNVDGETLSIRTDKDFLFFSLHFGDSVTEREED